MKKIQNRIILCIILALVTIVLCAIFYFAKQEKISLNTITDVNTEQYVIGVYKEKIAVFAQDDKIPIEVFDIYVSTLPTKDQKDLKKGVKVSGKIKLRERIEDYTS